MSTGNDGGDECLNGKMRRPVTIQQSTGKLTQRDFELRHFSGGLRGGLQNQTSVGPTITIQSENDLTILLLERLERNTTMTNPKNGKDAHNANSKFVASAHAKSTPQKNSEIILDSSEIAETLLNHCTHCLPLK